MEQQLASMRWLASPASGLQWRLERFFEQCAAHAAETGASSATQEHARPEAAPGLARPADSGQRGFGGGAAGLGHCRASACPTSNTALTRFDAIIVLGNPADADGNPSPTQQALVTEAVHEYERGVAPRLIVTGGAVANRFVEARVMARTAEAQGIPASAIFVEPEARNTIENACYSERIMKATAGGRRRWFQAPATCPARA